MGDGRFGRTDWQDYASRHFAGRSRGEIFAARALAAHLDPARVAVRESRDSASNPCATPVILASDVTGSMGMIAESLIRDGLIRLATAIYDRQPIPDPHIMVMAVGDATCDRAPLQVTQFEADIRLAEQTAGLFIEGGGGGNSGESYSLPHLFAALKTATDQVEKRGRKGYLFTVGDEPILDGVTGDQIARVLGIEGAQGLTARDCLAMAQRSYEVFHVVIREGFAARGLDQVMGTWRPLLGERVIVLDDHRRLPETIVAVLEGGAGAETARPPVRPPPRRGFWGLRG